MDRSELYGLHKKMIIMHKAQWNIRNSIKVYNLSAIVICTLTEGPTKSFRFFVLLFFYISIDHSARHHMNHYAALMHFEEKNWSSFLAVIYKTANGDLIIDSDIDELHSCMDNHSCTVVWIITIKGFVSCFQVSKLNIILSPSGSIQLI